MTRRNTGRCGTAALIALLTMTGIAHADAIDGEWCFTDLRSFTIDGPNIVTPKGTSVTGEYDRHAFTYVVPAHELNAGQTVEMNLYGDDDLRLTTGPKDGKRSTAEMWRRCNVSS